MFENGALLGEPRARAMLRHWAGRIVLLAVAAAALAYGASLLLPPEYEGEARLLVGSLTETSTDQLDAYQQLAQTYSTIAMSTTVLNRVIARLRLPDDATRLARRVDVRPMPGQAIIRITARAPTGAGAAGLANAMADEVVELAAQTDSGAPSLAAIFQGASPPPEPSFPRPLLNAAVAGALALILGIALVLLFPRVPQAAAAPEATAAPVAAPAPVAPPAPAEDVSRRETRRPIPRGVGGRFARRHDDTDAPVPMA